MTDELDFITALRTIATTPAARGLEDDAAVLEVGGETLVLTHDAMVEGVHFLPHQDMADVAWKLVATNLSDLAAKGAKPVGVLLGHMLGDNDARFIKGLKEALEVFETPLLGGDTVGGTGAARSFGMTAIGVASHTPVPSRSSAAPGDELYVTGQIGAAMLGFEALRDGTAACSLAYRRPVPLLEQGIALAPLVTAMMDVSDGLLLDCWRMASASGATIQLDPAAIPVADPARFDECIRWGDDYQLLFTLPQGMAAPTGAQRIGTVAARSPSPLRLGDTAFADKTGLGYTH